MGELRRPYYYTKDPESGDRVRHQQRTWVLRYYRDGRRHEESSHTTKKGDAARLLKLREGAIVQGIPVTANAGQLRFDEAAAAVMTDYKINGRRSLVDVEHRIRLHLKPHFGGRRMASITTADIRAYSAQRLAPVTLEDGTEKPGAAHATVNRELAVLKRAFRLALQGGTLLHMPHIPMLREAAPRSGFFEHDEFNDVRQALPEELQGIVTFGYLCGWRIRSEILPLTWAQIDRAAKIVRLEPGSTKNDEGRTLPYDLLPEMVDVIERQWREHERLVAEGMICPYVFHRSGRPIRGFVKAWKSACQTAGCPGKLPHDFRRTAIRNLVRSGVPEKTAMAITGHKTRSVFDRYDIVNEADLRNALGKLAGTSSEQIRGKEKGRWVRSGRVVELPQSSQVAENKG